MDAIVERRCFAADAYKILGSVMMGFAGGLAILMAFAVAGEVGDFNSTYLYIVSVLLLVVYQLAKNGPRILELLLELIRERRRVREAVTRKRVIIYPRDSGKREGL